MPKKIGRYEIIRELGRGGMAIVYLARDPKFKRQVAVKVLPSQLTLDPRFRARFEREAEVVASLEDEAIVPVYDYGDEGDQPYIVMRYLSGGSLRDKLKHGPLDLTEAARIVKRLAPALDKAHKQSIIHRDLKPENILFDSEGQPYVSDFGIAKLAEGKSLSGTMVFGTPEYMSPEQVQGKAALDGRSDQYAMGIVLFEMLAGGLPFKATTPMGLAMAHVQEKPVALHAVRNELPRELSKVVSQALEKSAARRYDSMCELSDAIQEGLVGKARTTKLPKKVPPTRVLPKRKRAASGETGGLGAFLSENRKLILPGLLLIAAAGFWGALGNRTPQSQPVPTTSQVEAVATRQPTATAQPAVVVASTKQPTATRTAAPTPIPAGYITLPNVVGMHYRDAAPIIEQLDVKFTLDSYRNSCDFDLPRGTITKQEPPAGQAVPPGTDVLLHRASIPASMGRIAINSLSGSIDYGGILQAGPYFLDVQHDTNWPFADSGDMTAVELRNAQGELLQKFDIEIRFGTHQVVRQGIQLPETACYIFRVYYRVPLQASSNPNFGWISLDRQ